MIGYFNEQDRKLDRYCYCCDCGKPMWENTGFSWSTERGMQCSRCYHHKIKARRKGKTAGVQHSKPLHPRSGGVFYPDRMEAGHYRTTFLGVSEVSGRVLYGKRIKYNHREITRQNRKRQRRVDQYFIDLALADMESSSDGDGR